MSSSWKFIWRKVLTQCFTFVPGYIGLDVRTQVKYCTVWAFCTVQSIIGRVGGLPNNLGNVNNGDKQTSPKAKCCVR